MEQSRRRVGQLPELGWTGMGWRAGGLGGFEKEGESTALVRQKRESSE